MGPLCLYMGLSGLHRRPVPIRRPSPGQAVTRFKPSMQQLSLPPGVSTPRHYCTVPASRRSDAGQRRAFRGMCERCSWWSTSRRSNGNRGVGPCWWAGPGTSRRTSLSRRAYSGRHDAHAPSGSLRGSAALRGPRKGPEWVAGYERAMDALRRDLPYPASARVTSPEG